jgi:hypothetical protein
VTPSSSPNLAQPLGQIPPGLRNELLAAFEAIVRNYRERRWEPSELNGGKFCEIVYTILEGHVGGAFAQRAKKPTNMVDACRDLEKYPSSFPRSVRIQIPRALLALYEVRNNRGVGHVGGDVDPNHMDATLVLASAKWILAELVRMFHDVTPEEAADVVGQLVEREVPLVWEIDDVRRVLRPGLTMKDKSLLLLYDAGGRLLEVDLVRWVEHGNSSAYRRDVLRPLHKARLVEYDWESKLVTLSPLGAKDVEERLLPEVA